MQGMPSPPTASITRWRAERSEAKPVGWTPVLGCPSIVSAW